MDHNMILPIRSAAEWSFRSEKPYENPFADVTLDAIFTGPDGRSWTVPGFYDGDATWRVRFNPNQAGAWRYRLVSRPVDEALSDEGQFQVTGEAGRGFLKSTPGQGWGFTYESGEPAFLLGDTAYHLFGMAYCGLDVDSFLERRASQGFNLLRVRLPVSPFHPPEGYSDWQTRRTWPWGGSEQSPRFDQFNLGYFQAADRVVRKVEALGTGLELIMEGWGFEFPFNNRAVFLPEWEELWLRYLIARYDAFGCVYFWTLHNEYEFYPNGDARHTVLADRWALRVTRWMRGLAQHGHIFSIHNAPQMPPFAWRFRADPSAMETIMYQCWGSMGKDDSWLAAGIEDQIRASLEGWPGTALMAEYGYERNPELDNRLPYHDNCTPEHTRRGAWRSAFCGLAVMNGFENSWGPWAVLDRDQVGLAYLLHLRRFFTELAPFAQMRPADGPVDGLVQEEAWTWGSKPLAMATPGREVVAIYLPTGGRVTPVIEGLEDYQASWFDPRTAEISPAQAAQGEWVSPFHEGEEGHPPDAVLLLKKKSVF